MLKVKSNLFRLAGGVLISGILLAGLACSNPPLTPTPAPSEAIQASVPISAPAPVEAPTDKVESVATPEPTPVPTPDMYPPTPEQALVPIFPPTPEPTLEPTPEPTPIPEYNGRPYNQLQGEMDVWGRFKAPKGWYSGGFSDIDEAIAYFDSLPPYNERETIGGYPPNWTEDDQACHTLWRESLYQVQPRLEEPETRKEVPNPVLVGCPRFEEPEPEEVEEETTEVLN